MSKQRQPSITDKYRSTTHYVLSSLIPYTEANLKLSFKPTVFFNDLEKIDKHKASRGKIQMSYYRSIKEGLVSIDPEGTPQLTDEGRARLRRYEPAHLTGTASVLVIFDIPEEQRRLRGRLRVLLRELRFTQIQKSVWQSEYDVVEYLLPDLRKYGLDEYVQVHETVRIV